MTSPGPRPLSRRLAQQRDEILAHVNDPAVPFHRFDVVGDVGSGKTMLRQAVADHCTGRGLLVLNVRAPRVTYAGGNLAQDRELADLYACSDLIASFIASIDTFRKQHPESRAAADRAIESLRRIRSIQRLHHLVVTERVDDVLTQQERLAVVQDETESVLRSLAHEYNLAILIDDVHLLDNTSTQDWLRALLRRIPTLCTVTSRLPGSDSWRQGQTGDDRTLEFRNMTLEEVREYLRDRQLAFTEDEARQLFEWTGGHGFAVATWCDLALDAGVGGFTELVSRAQQAAGDPGFTSLTEGVQLAVDQIPVDVLGYQLPLFALLTIAETVTTGLIAMLEGEAGQRPSEWEAKEIYHRLASRRFISEAGAGEGLYLTRAISDVAWRRLREQDPVVFRRMHSYAEAYQRDLVDLDAELVDRATPFAFWLRFEKPEWVRGVACWLDHAKWLDPQQFEQMKPALVKIYLDAFWWWDDSLRSAATSLLLPALRRVADQQQDELWANALEKFSDHWVSSWDEAVLRANPREWRLALDAIRRLLGIFGLERGVIPEDLKLRRVYILLCNFYGKALWYAGEADQSRAEEADQWLADAAAACATPDDEKDEDNPNGWIGSWALLRRAEIWSTLDQQRARGYLNGLDRKAIDDQDSDLRVGIAMLIGDLLWRNNEIGPALHAYSRALLISYAYNVQQENRRKAPNLYTKSLYASAIGRVEKRAAELQQAGKLQVLGMALDTMRQLFKPYWDRVRDWPDPPPALPRFALPVPPPPEGGETSTLETEDEISKLNNEYVDALEDLALSQAININKEIIINATVDELLSGGSRGRQEEGIRIHEVPGPGPVIEAFYHQILQPSFRADALIDLDELQAIAAASDKASVWLAEADDGTILGGAVAEWDESVRVVLLDYLAVRPGIRGGGVGGQLYLAALDSWRQRFKPCLVLAELEDPAVHSDSERYGDPAARLRFYVNRGSRILDIPYFQPALDPDSDRISGLLLIVLHADPDFAGADDGTIDAGVVRKFLENYQIQYEGKIAMDDQAMAMWRVLDRPEGIHLRDQ